MTVQLKVPSMVCSSCVNSVTKALNRLEEDAHVNIDLENKIVTMDGKSSEDAMKKAIRAIGHIVD
jgi:copper chaperone